MTETFVPAILIFVFCSIFNDGLVHGAKFRLNRDDSCGTRPGRYGPGFEFIPKESNQGSVSIIGDVNDVLFGRVTTTTKSIKWSAQGVVGFGAGAIDKLSGLGEALTINGYTYVRQTDNTTENYFQTIYGAQYLSPFAVYIPRTLRPNGIASFISRRPDKDTITFMELYKQMYDAVQGTPFCFYGLTEYSMLEAIAVSKAPIYNEPLFGELAQGYYTQPNFHINNGYALTFGCAANFTNIQDEALRSKLSKALYVNPLDEGSSKSLQVHSHVLTVKDCVSEINQIRPETALEVYHLLSNSTVNYFSAKVFSLDSSNKVKEIIGNIH